MAHDMHVLLVEHDSKDRDKLINLLEYFSYKVTTVKLASTALSTLTKEKAQFDIVMANINSPDLYVFLLLQEAYKRNLLMILMCDDDNVATTIRALQQGASLCITKPISMEIIGYLWQHVARDKVHRIKENERFRDIIGNSTCHKEFGEDLMEDSQKNSSIVEENQKTELNSKTLQHDGVMFKKKVWTEWTQELHKKFINAVIQLGEGRCYPKEILELMNVPGLTRMQVASHLQKCRNANWLPPNERKSKLANTRMETPLKNKASRSKTMRFGSMPHLEHNTQLRIGIKEYYKNHREFAINQPAETNVHEDNHDGNTENVYYPQLLDRGCNPLAQGNQIIFNIGQLGNTFGMDELSGYGFQSVSSNTNSSTNSRNIIEDAFEFPSMDFMIQNFPPLQQELGVDCNGSWQSLVLDHVQHNQMPLMNNARANQWSQQEHDE